MRRSLFLVFLLALSFNAYANPRPDHVLVVIEENHSFDEIVNQRHSYMRKLARRGALFLNSYGVTHPSQPNYLALFSGSTHGVDNDNCPVELQGENLASALQSHGLGFAIYSEDLPNPDDRSCANGAYQRKHNPAADWADMPLGVNLPFNLFPKDYSKLPTVSFVIPNLNHDMHDGSPGEADQWLHTHIKPYVEWAKRHNSLLILTWDEDDYKGDNRIATILIGPMVKPGKNPQRIDHYSVLRTLLDFYGLPPLGESANAQPIGGIWKN
jgi:acid phosphatase